MTGQTSSMEVRFGVVILAAGASRRMGRPKLLLPWGDSSVLGHLVDLWQGLGATQVALVVAPSHDRLKAELQGDGRSNVGWIVNPEPESGMFSSIQSAARWTHWRSDLTHWLISLGDQPQVQRATLESLVAQGRRHPDKVVQPSWAGRARHPVWLPARQFRALQDSDAPDFRAYLRTTNPLRVEGEDPGLGLDMDYPQEYQAALRMAGLPAAEET